MNPSELKAYAGKLKKKTGTGGSLKDGVIEIQGDYRDKIGEILKKDGWNIKQDWHIEKSIGSSSYKKSEGTSHKNKS